MTCWCICLCLPYSLWGGNLVCCTDVSILQNEGSTSKALLLTQLSLENWAPTANELAVFQQQRAAEPSPSAWTLPMDSKTAFLVRIGSERARETPAEAGLGLTFVSWEGAAPGSWAWWLQWIQLLMGKSFSSAVCIHPSKKSLSHPGGGQGWHGLTWTPLPYTRIPGQG